MCQLTHQMNPNSAQMIDVVNTKTGNATHDGLSNLRPIQSAARASQLIRCVRCAYPVHSIDAATTAAAIDRPITWFSPAPRAGASARTATPTSLPPDQDHESQLAGQGVAHPLTPRAQSNEHGCSLKVTVPPQYRCSST